MLKQLKKPESLITFVKDRPGHDRRYAIDQTKIMNELNWRPAVDFKGLIEMMVDADVDRLASTPRQPVPAR